MIRHAPAPAPSIPLVGIDGQPVQIGNGRKLLRSLFRVDDLSNNYPNLSNLGPGIVAVFKSDQAEMRKFIASLPRPGGAP
ncbi:MAG: hypothetical protein Q8O64_16155 [Sideroxyarcus sp.]|nr:hypothetical protein [Sideroxyarcus sp.]